MSRACGSARLFNPRAVAIACVHRASDAPADSECPARSHTLNGALNTTFTGLSVGATLMVCACRRRLVARAPPGVSPAAARGEWGVLFVCVCGVCVYGFVRLHARTRA